MKRVRLNESDLSANPSKKRRVESRRTRSKYKINANIDDYSDAIEPGNEYKYNQSIQIQFKACEEKICIEHQKKLNEIELELQQTKIFIDNKYEYKAEIINNEYIELINRAKKKIIVKYEEKKSKLERLFKDKFEKHCKQTQKPNTNEDIYKRQRLIINNNKNTEKTQFFDPILQEKWSAMRGIAENDMESDVNKLMLGYGMQELRIKDILSRFPQCHVAYKSDKHILEIDNFIVKVSSQIACQYKGQCVMIGMVTSIANKDLWCRVRQKGDEFAQYSLCNIKIQDIEQGTVKIKLMN